ncbi:MAG: rRNA maturation RNase YbeY [Muribaculaceae bacterium]|nr:rRNA maturation RNase YbeY [Muribaculaceae bacterium]
MTEIVYMTHGNVEMPKLDETAVRDWIVEVASRHGQRVGCLTYVFCDDEYILSTNREFLGHDYYTDIITFDYTNSRHIAGDMVISLDTVRSNAEMLGTDYRTELMRVIIHGVLHLCGINDKGPGEREIMEQHENDALAVLPSNIFLND